MITVHASKHPLRDEWLEPVEVEPDQTVAEICGTDQLFAWINGRQMPDHMIKHMRLKDGGTVVVRIAPQDGNILKSVLMIGVAIAAGALTAGLGTPLVAGSWGAIAAGSTLSVAGAIRYNNMVKP